MKSLISLAVLATLLLIGCADKPISTIETDNQSYQLIKLPPKAGLSIENTFSVTKTINGDEGGTIKLKKSYVAGDGHTVKIDVKFKVKKHSFEGNKEITMTVDDIYAAVTFTPHMIFTKPTTLQVKFEGIDLEELQLAGGTYDFVFIGDDGTIEMIDHDGVKVKENKGNIMVQKAYLTHFSRYAFTR